MVLHLRETPPLVGPASMDDIQHKNVPHEREDNLNGDTLKISHGSDAQGTPLPPILPCAGFKRITHKSEWTSPPGNPHVVELVFPVAIRSSLESTTVTTLVDTGCRMPLCARMHLFQEGSLTPAKFPVKIRTANGMACAGGQVGLLLQLTLPLVNTDGSVQYATFEPAWCYIADIQGVDLIIGYPYLRNYGLLVDTGQHCLRPRISADSQSYKPPMDSVETVTNVIQYTHSPSANSNTHTNFNIPNPPGCVPCPLLAMPVSGASEPHGSRGVLHEARVRREGHSTNNNSRFSVTLEGSPVPAADCARVWSQKSRIGGSPTGNSNTGVTASLHWFPRRKSIARCWGLDTHTDTSTAPREPLWQKSMARYQESEEPSWQKSQARYWKEPPTPTSHGIQLPTPTTCAKEPFGHQNLMIPPTPLALMDHLSLCGVTLETVAVPVSGAADPSLQIAPLKKRVEKSGTRCIHPTELLLGDDSETVKLDTIMVDEDWSHLAESEDMVQNPLPVTLLSGNLCSMQTSHDAHTSVFPTASQNGVTDILSSSPLSGGEGIPTPSHGTDFCDPSQDMADCPCNIFGLTFDAFEQQGLSHLRALKFRKHLKRETYTLSDLWLERIIAWSGLTPTVDAFANRQNKRFSHFWTASSNAFKKCWKWETLWLNPPFSKLNQVLEKILQDEAQGILLIPVWPSRIWFHALSRIAVKWWDLPRSEPIFMSYNNQRLPPKPWFVRAVVFNAFNALQRMTSPSSWYNPHEDNMGEFPSIQHMTSLNAFYAAEFVPMEIPMDMFPTSLQYPSPGNNTAVQSLSVDTAKPQDAADYVQQALFGVIASADPCSKAALLIEQLTKEYADVLSKPKLAKDVNPALRGPYGVAKIILKDGARPTRKSPFRMIGEREEAMRVFVDKYLARGWITPTKSEWAAQAFVVPKPPDSRNPGVKQWRMVVDYRYLNSQTKDDCYPLPLIDDLIVKQSKNRLWSIFDLEDGFHQMHLEEESRHLTAFVTTFGAYEFTVLPMGVKNGPSMFQRMIQWALREIPCVLVYIDDVLVGTPESEDTIQSHLQDVSKVLDAFRRNSLAVKGSKMHLFMTMVKFCGHLLFEGKRKAAPSRFEALVKWTPQMVKTVTHLKSFLGLCQYYSPYVRNYAVIVAPLTDQLKSRSAEHTSIVWSDEMRNAFEKIKAELLTNVVLEIADPCKPYVLEVDACDHAVGGVLSQHDTKGDLRPVAFFSRKLQGSPGKGQCGWSIREKETYAIVLILQKFRSWLASTSVEIRVLTDHQSLQHWYHEDLNKMTAAVGRRGRWHEFLSQFNLTVVYTKGEDHKVSDPLSRWAYPASLEQGDESFHGTWEAQDYAHRCDILEDLYDGFPTSEVHTVFVTPLRASYKRKFGGKSKKAKKRIVRSEASQPIFYQPWNYADDATYGPIVQAIQAGIRQTSYTFQEGRLMKDSKYCVPTPIVETVIHQYHLYGHPGINKLKAVLERRYAFSLTPRELYVLCERECRTCQVCQAVKPRSGRQPGTLDFCPIPEQIFASLCMDFLDVPEVTDSHGNCWNYIFVIVCRTSGYIDAIPCQKSGLTAQRVAEMFLTQCVKYMGIPNEILSDNDHLITSHFFTTLCELTGIEQHSSIIYRPQGNGRAEAAVKAVVAMLRKAVLQLRQTWLIALPWALHQINTLPGLLLCYSPYMIVFGREPICLGDIPSSKRSRVSVSCEAWFDRIVRLRTKVRQLVTDIHMRRHAKFLRDHPSPTYEPGDLVWVRNSAGDTFDKLDVLWTGPCEILHRYGSTGRYQVALPQGAEDVHMERFKPYLPPISGNPIPCLYFKPHPKLPETDDYVVKDIIAHRFKGGQHQWRVRWKGYGSEDDTWEPAKSFVGLVQQDWLKWNKEHNINLTLEDVIRT